MADERTRPAGNDDRKQLVRDQIAGTGITLAPIEEPADLARAKKVPLGQIASIGTAFASIPEAFRTVTRTVTTPASGTLMQAFDKTGNRIDISQLQGFSDGSGKLGSIRIDGTFQQAHFYQADPQTVTASATIPYDPATLAMAIALQQINQKLDAIQKTVGDMFDYMRQRDKAAMRGNLRTLADVLDGYRLNWDNPRYMDNAHMKVLDIKQAATQDMEFYSGQTKKKLAGKAPVEVRGMVSARLDGVLDSLKDYQLATYIYAFASFLDPMLSENFKAERLADVAARIEDASIRYRELYTSVYNALESSAAGSVNSAVLGGLASAGRLIGSAVEATPVGDRTLIDEALVDGGRALSGFDRKRNARLLEKLHAAKSPDVLPFQESVKSIDELYNRPSQLLTDGDNLYILPTAPAPEQD